MDDLYVCGTNLVDRRPDRDLMREFTSISKELSNMNQQPDFERQLLMIKPHLHTGMFLFSMKTKAQYITNGLLTFLLCVHHCDIPFTVIISLSAGQSSFNLGMQIAVPATSLQFINAEKALNYVMESAGQMITEFSAL